MKTKSYLLIFLIFLSMKCEPDPESGCTDSKALNQDFGAEENDGSCRYSDVSFYAKFPLFNGIPITRIAVIVNEIEIGEINGTIYPAGPANCSAPGTVQYTFSDGISVDWNATLYLANGTVLYETGQIAPRSSSSCIVVNITN